MAYINFGATNADTFPPWVPKDLIKTCQDNKQVIHWLGLLTDIVAPALDVTGVLTPVGISMHTVSGLLSYFAGTGSIAGTLQEEAKKGSDACKLLTVVVGLFGTGGTLASVAGAEAAPVLAAAGSLYAAFGIILDPISKGKTPSVQTMIAFGTACWAIATFTKGGVSSVGPIASPITSAQAKDAMATSSKVISALNAAPASLKSKKSSPTKIVSKTPVGQPQEMSKLAVAGTGVLVLLAAFSISNALSNR